MRCLFHTNIFDVLNVIQVALPHKLKQSSGQVINISSTSGYRFSAGFSVYFATKFGVEVLSDALYEELRPLGIQISVVGAVYFRTSWIVA